MLDPSGASQNVVVSRSLWLLLAPLAAGLASHVLACVLRPDSGSGRSLAREASRARLVGLACVGFATGAALVHALVLFHAPQPGRAYVECITRGVRVGAIDANFVLWLDGVSAAACAFVCLLSFTVGVWIAAHPHVDRGPAVWACLELALAGALASFLADGLIAALVGWSLSIAAASWLAGWKDPGAGVVGATRGAVALSMLAFGACWLFWASAGRWQDREFTVEQSVGFSAVSSPPSVPGRGSLTMTHAAGASVYLGDARAPAATAPFADLDLPRAVRSIRIHSGRPSDERDADAIVGVEIPERGASITLIPSGPSLSMRDRAASIDAMRAGPSPRWAPAPATVTAVLCIWVVAAWLVSVPFAVADAPVPLATVAQGVAGALIGPLWLERASALVALAPRMRLVLPAAAIAILAAAVSVLWTAIAGRNESRAMGAAAALLERSPARLGLLLVRFEQWVLCAVARLIAALVGVAAWLAVRFDDGVVSMPGDAAAAQAVRFGRGVESIFGLPIGRIAWVLVGVAAAVVAAHGWWSDR